MGKIFSSKEVEHQKIPTVACLQKAAAETIRIAEANNLEAVIGGSVGLEIVDATRRSDIDLFATKPVNRYQNEPFKKHARLVELNQGIKIEPGVFSIRTLLELPTTMKLHFIHATNNSPFRTGSIGDISKKLTVPTCDEKTTLQLLEHVEHKRRFFESTPINRKLAMQRALELPAAIGRTLISLNNLSVGRDLDPHISKASANSAIDMVPEKLLPLQAKRFLACLQVIDADYTELVEEVAATASVRDYQKWLSPDLVDFCLNNARTASTLVDTHLKFTHIK